MKLTQFHVPPSFWHDISRPTFKILYNRELRYDSYFCISSELTPARFRTQALSHIHAARIDVSINVDGELETCLGDPVVKDLLGERKNSNATASSNSALRA